MKVNISYPYRHGQYDLGLEVVQEALVTEGHSVVITRGDDIDKSCDCFYTNNVFPFLKGPKPRFYSVHGCSVVKRQTYDQNMQFFLAFSTMWDGYFRRERDEMYNENQATSLITGYPRADVLLRVKVDSDLHRESLVSQYRLDGRPILFYCPTFRRKSGWRDVYSRSASIVEVVRSLEEDYNVFVAPHSFEDYEDLSPIQDRLVPDGLERIRCMAAADLFIGDTSGMICESLVFDKPVVLLSNEHPRKYFLVRISDTLQFFDVGLASRNVADLKSYVARSLNDEDVENHYRPKRTYWAHQAMGFLDGRNSVRVVQAMEKGVEMWNNDWENLRWRI